MKLYNLALVATTLLATSVVGEKWAWPDQKQQQVDGKLRFEDEAEAETNDSGSRQSGLYRSAESGDYPPQSYGRRASYTDRRPTSQDPQDWVAGHDDTLQYCRCLRSRQCVYPGFAAPASVQGSCQTGKFLCCYERPRKPLHKPADSGAALGSSRYQNPINAAELDQQNVLVGPGGPTGVIGPTGAFGASKGNRLTSSVLVGPGGPTGIVGPNAGSNRPNSGYIHGPGRDTENHILVGPGGPTGIIGPNPGNRRPYSGVLGPAERPVLVGPGGPTGIIGPNTGIKRPYNGLLVGPGGPTGVIGPTRRPILAGPGGPTGIIGPASVIKTGHPNGILVGPGGPTGIVGPGPIRQNNRGILVGPGGPTGIVGPIWQRQ